jgi:hypothetical protein
MENEVPMSQPPAPQAAPQYQEPVPPAYPDIEAMKAQARELAIQQVMASRTTPVAAPSPQQVPPKVIYVRRNLTVAELIVVFAIAWGIVAGIPFLWNSVANRLPQIEIKLK